MSALTNLGYATAFAAGTVSFLSPCVLPLVPGYVSYVAGQSLGRTEASGRRSNLEVFALSLCFVFGFTTVFVALGAGASALGTLLAAYRIELNVLAGLIVILFGLFATGLVQPSWLNRELRWHSSLPGGRPVAAYLLGTAFALGWTPCIGPVLGAILAITASSASANGMTLLAVYSLGLGVPFVLAALFLSRFVGRLNALRHIGYTVRLLGGAVMIVMGVAMITGHLTQAAIWFMETFPALAAIG